MKTIRILFLLLTGFIALAGCVSITRLQYAQVARDSAIVNKTCSDFYGTAGTVKVDERTNLIVRTKGVDSDLIFFGPLLPVIPIRLPVFSKGQALEISFQGASAEDVITKVDFKGARLEKDAGTYFLPSEVFYTKKTINPRDFSIPQAPVQNVTFRFRLPKSVSEHKTFKFSFGQPLKTITLNMDRKVHFGLIDGSKFIPESCVPL